VTRLSARVGSEVGAGAVVLVPCHNPLRGMVGWAGGPAGSCV
jgi:hypothetical protein